MGLLADIRNFLQKHVKNPLVIGALAFLIYKMLQKHTSSESLIENIQIIAKKSTHEIIFDTTTGLYHLIRFGPGGEQEIKTSKDLAEIKMLAKRESLHKRLEKLR